MARAGHSGGCFQTLHFDFHLHLSLSDGHVTFDDDAGTETEASLRKRLDNAVKEMEESKRLSWDGYIVNDDKDKAYVQLRALLAEGRENCMKARAAAAAAAAAAASAAPCGCPHKAAAAAAAAAGSK